MEDHHMLVQFHETSILSRGHKRSSNVASARAASASSAWESRIQKVSRSDQMEFYKNDMGHLWKIIWILIEILDFLMVKMIWT